MTQNENEPVHSYFVRPRATALDCDFTCLSSEHDLSDIYIKDQLIRGIANDTFQADQLAKAGTLKSLEQNVSHDEALKSALRDQNSMPSTSDIAAARMSTCRNRKNTSQANKGNIRTTTYPYYGNSDAKPSCQTCVGYGSQQHGVPGTGSRQLKCPTCNNCGKPNHQLRVCRAKKPGRAVRKRPETNEAHITFNLTTDTHQKIQT